MFWLRDGLVAAGAVRMWEALFAFHICIAELLPELLGRAVVQPAMGPFAVILAPVCQGTQMSFSVRNQVALRHSSRSLPWKLSTSRSHRAARLDVVSERTFSGRPRSAITRSSTRVTRPDPRLVSASSARHSRVYASTTLRMRTIRPVA